MAAPLFPFSQALDGGKDGNKTVTPKPGENGIMKSEKEAVFLAERRLLVIEDDAAIAKALILNLQCAGYQLTHYEDGAAALEGLKEDHAYDLALLDMMLPGVDGFGLLPRLREYGIPVICLTALTDVQSEIRGLKEGAEDYVAKPFRMAALLVRIEKVLARSGKQIKVYSFRDLELDGENRTLRQGEKIINLPPMEFDVFLVLMKNKNRTVSREQILSEIWGYEYFGDLRTVDVRIAALRKKLNLSEEIRTIPRSGYRLEEL